jgi:hypothetical protein
MQRACTGFFPGAMNFAPGGWPGLTQKEKRRSGPRRFQNA